MNSNYNLKALKGKIKNIDELRELANLKEIKFTEAELTAAYNEIMSDDGEISLDDLETINGGKKEKPYGTKEDQHIYNYVKYRCKYCNTLIWFPIDLYAPHQCPKCKKLQRYNRKNEEC